MTKAKENNNLFSGFPASSGIVIGRAFVIDRHHICVLETSLQPGEIENEIERFHEAVERCYHDMAELKENAVAELGEQVPFTILDSHSQILKDPSMTKDIENVIRDRNCNAEWALHIIMERYQETFSKFSEVYFRERLLDIEQVITRLQRQLIKDEPESLDHLTEPVILIAHDLTPADTFQMDRDKVIGFAIDVGGKTSHASIVASSMDIPAVVGLKNLSLLVRTGDHVIVDGSTGEVVHLPTDKQFIKYNKRRQNFIYFDESVHSQKDLKAVTKDNVKITVMANIESSKDLPHLAEHGAEGVGLYRTEYLYLNSSKWPDEEEQFADYKKVAEATSPDYAVIRTLDIGGDKFSSSLDVTDHEPNPALGLRAIRYCLQNPEIFKTQLRAILRASHYGAIKIMYPLITSPEELSGANAFLEECKNELTKEGRPFDTEIEVGIMIETPSSVMVADTLAKNCAFFSIGTNDLIQYTMAIDRINEKVAYLYEPLSPAILKMLALTIEAGEKAGIPVSVCGKMAGDPAYALLLLGLGQISYLSMDVHSIPRQKKFIRSISISDAKAAARQALEFERAEDVQVFMKQWMDKYTEEGITSDLVRNVD